MTVPRQAGFQESEGTPEPGFADALRTRDAIFFAPQPRSPVWVSEWAVTRQRWQQTRAQGVSSWAEARMGTGWLTS